MDQLFLHLCNLSLTAGWLVLAVLLLRWVLRKAPRWVHCLLWGLVGLRLLVPVPLKSLFSLLPSGEPIPPDILLSPDPAIDSSIPLLNQWINPILSGAFAPNPGDSVNPLQVWFTVGGWLWLAGVAAMLLYCMVSVLRLRRQTAASLRLRDRVYCCDEVASPFILGVFRPRIYLPSTLTAEQTDYVLRHEEAHLKRRDHWWKPLGYLLLTVHWFNPLLWAAYLFLCRDIEGACDEKVAQTLTPDQRKGYSETLLACSVPARALSACPLAFGEVSVKSRIRAVLHYKKPAFWVLAAALAVCLLAAALLLPSPALSRRVPAGADAAIRQAVLDGHHSEYTDDYYAGADYRVLGVAQKEGRTVVYAWVLYQEYTQVLDRPQASYIPSVFTLTEAQGQYTVEEYWTPRDGIYYGPDIRAKFPVTLWLQAMDGTRWQDEMTRRLEAEAAAHYAGLPAMDAESIVLRTAYANYSDRILYDSALNGDRFTDSSVCHLPLYRVDSVDQLAAFTTQFPGLEFDRGYNEVPSFRQITADCDADFFAAHTLFIVYVPTSDSSCRYTITAANITDRSMEFSVGKTWNPQSVDTAMCGWWITAAVPRAQADASTRFDAHLLLAEDDILTSVKPPLDKPSTVKNNRAVVLEVRADGLRVRPDDYIHTNDRAFLHTEYFFLTENTGDLQPGDPVMITHTGEFVWGTEATCPIGKALAVGKA